MLETTQKGKWFEIIIPTSWEGLTIEDVFKKIWESPRKLTHTFRMENKVLLDGQRTKWNIPLISGSKLLINVFEEDHIEVPSSFLEVAVLYEDEHLIVFNKPPFMNTHPNQITLETDTLLNAAAFYIQAKGEVKNIRHIHRLDRNTTGAVLFAKHSLAGAILDRMLEQRKIKRTYVAIIHGLLSTNKGTIRERIGRDRHHATKRRVSPTGQEAITHFQVLKADKVKKITYVKCWLETGRTHQIRVHFNFIGHPLAGDILYGGKPLYNRQALHAAKLEFIHPLTEEKITCYAPFIDAPPIFEDIDIYEL